MSNEKNVHSQLHLFPYSSLFWCKFCPFFFEFPKRQTNYVFINVSSCDLSRQPVKSKRCRKLSEIAQCFYGLHKKFVSVLFFLSLFFSVTIFTILTLVVNHTVNYKCKPLPPPTLSIMPFLLCHSCSGFNILNSLVVHK